MSDRASGNALVFVSGAWSDWDRVLGAVRVISAQRLMVLSVRTPSNANRQSLCNVGAELELRDSHSSRGLAGFLAEFKPTCVYVFATRLELLGVVVDVVVPAHSRGVRAVVYSDIRPE